MWQMEHRLFYGLAILPYHNYTNNSIKIYEMDVGWK